MGDAAVTDTGDRIEQLREELAEARAEIEALKAQAGLPAEPDPPRERPKLRLIKGGLVVAVAGWVWRHWRQALGSATAGATALSLLVSNPVIGPEELWIPPSQQRTPPTMTVRPPGSTPVTRPPPKTPTTRTTGTATPRPTARENRPPNPTQSATLPIPTRLPASLPTQLPSPTLRPTSTPKCLPPLLVTVCVPQRTN